MKMRMINQVRSEAMEHTDLSQNINDINAVPSAKQAMSRFETMLHNRAGMGEHTTRNPELSRSYIRGNSTRRPIHSERPLFVSIRAASEVEYSECRAISPLPDRQGAPEFGAGSGEDEPPNISPFSRRRSLPFLHLLTSGSERPHQTPLVIPKSPVICRAYTDFRNP
jgi:hypothetical protein